MEWRKLSWLPDYEVSECGHLRRATQVHSHVVGRIIKSRPDRKGYSRYCVTVANGKRRTVLAQRLVCEAWHGPPPSPAHQAAHNDGSKTNNHYSNLRWATPAENIADKARHGTDQVGERHPRSRLTWEQVRAIRKSYTGQRGEYRELGRQYGVSWDTISYVVRGLGWKETEPSA